MTRLARVRRGLLLTVIGGVATLLAAACATGTPASDPTPSVQVDCPTWDAKANPKTLPAQSHDITARFSEECVRSFVGEGFVAPDLSPRYTLNAFGLSVDPPSRDFRIFYEPKSTKDPRVLLQLFADRAYPAFDISEITTRAGNVIWVGMGEGGYSGAWSRGDWDYIAVALDTKAKHDDIMSQIADAVFAGRAPATLAADTGFSLTLDSVNAEITFPHGYQICSKGAALEGVFQYTLCIPGTAHAMGFSVGTYSAEADQPFGLNRQPITEVLARVSQARDDGVSAFERAEVTDVDGLDGVVVRLRLRDRLTQELWLPVGSGRLLAVWALGDTRELEPGAQAEIWSDVIQSVRVARPEP